VEVAIVDEQGSLLAQKRHGGRACSVVDLARGFAPREPPPSQAQALASVELDGLRGSFSPAELQVGKGGTNVEDVGASDPKFVASAELTTVSCLIERTGRAVGMDDFDPSRHVVGTDMGSSAVKPHNQFSPPRQGIRLEPDVVVQDHPAVRPPAGEQPRRCVTSCCPHGHAPLQVVPGQPEADHAECDGRLDLETERTRDELLPRQKGVSRAPVL